jgi:protoheme IX farnesyltransferase
VSNSFDAGAAILFSILALWQMPHFYAIAIRRLDDYRAAKIPVLPVVRGVRLTKVAILFYIIAFIIAAAMLAVLGYAGKMYLAVVLTIGVIWLALAIRGFWIADDQRWARGIFLTSLIVLTLLCAVIIVGG